MKLATITLCHGQGFVLAFDDASAEMMQQMIESDAGAICLRVAFHTADLVDYAFRPLTDEEAQAVTEADGRIRAHDTLNA